MRGVDVPKLLALLGIEWRRRHNELHACCPMPGHEERHPSWSIVDNPSSDRHGSHRCFGCKRGGGPVQLVAAVIGITEFSARDWLERNGCMVGEAEPDSLPTRVRCDVSDGLAPVLCLPAGVVVGRPLSEWPGPARRYLLGRGIGAWQVEHHGLGYAASGEQEGRVVFPVRNQYGTLVYYTGRTFAGDRCRYVSCRSVPGARPEAALFGESLWRTRGAFDEVYTTEGAVKALAIERVLCELGTGERGCSVAAFCGSELHEEQALKLRRFARLTHVADPDETGLAFARELKGKLCAGMGVRVVVPPGGRQADELSVRELRALLG